MKRLNVNFRGDVKAFRKVQAATSVLRILKYLQFSAKDLFSASTMSSCFLVKSTLAGASVSQSYVSDFRKSVSEAARFTFSFIGSPRAFVNGFNQICFSFLDRSNFNNSALEFFAHHFIYFAH